MYRASGAKLEFPAASLTISVFLHVVDMLFGVRVFFSKGTLLTRPGSFLIFAISLINSRK